MKDFINSSISIDMENVNRANSLKQSTFWKYQGFRALNMLITVILIIIAGVLLILGYFFVWLPIINMLK